MAPNASGEKCLDHAKLVGMCYNVLKFAVINSYPGGSFVCKLWNCQETEKVLTDVARFYSVAKKFKPKASRIDSAEIYIVAYNFKGLAS